MAGITLAPRRDVFRECSERIGAYLLETKRLCENLTLQEKELRIIDPALVNEPRFYSDDYRLVQLIKTIYYVIRSYFAHEKVRRLQERFRTVQQEISPREEVERRIVLAFNHAFNSAEGVESAIQVKEQFDTFARFHERVNFSGETNAFLKREELNGTPLAMLTERCLPPMIYSPDSVESSSSDEENVVWYDCDSGDSGSSAIEESLQQEASLPIKQAEITIETLFTNPKLYEIAGHFLPLSMVKSIEEVDEATYCLTFDGHLVGRIEKLEEGFAEKLEGIIKRRLREGADLLVNLRKDYPSVGTFLDAIGVKNLEDIGGVVYWNGLLGAWSSAEGSYCHLPEAVTIKVGETKIEILEGAFRAGVHITDYHSIKGNLLNRVFQGALYTCLKTLGLVTWGGSTKKPLHATFSINALKRLEGEEGIFLHVVGEEERGLAFDYDPSWQEPQNFPEKDIQALAKNPWKQINEEELVLIQMHLEWKVVERQ
ncbi:MAG: hypothetical protein KFB93_06580 [Simkaniaceae bacterium]|nr:MAG: hypothetical protein KFB93_06580 [Simkaniaceae bacterium]